MMRSKTLFSKLREALCNFHTARGGNVAIIFALATLPIIGGVSAAVDYSRANDIKVKLQAAVDSTALMLSKEAVNATPDQLNQNASKYLLAMFNPKGVENITANAEYTSNGGSQVVVKGSATVPTSFAGALGIDTITVAASSTAKWGSVRLRVALVLDNTGSMAQSGKMSALKSAAKNFLTQLNQAANANGDVYVSIIPFARDVNLDKSNWNANWIDWTDWNAEACAAWGAGNSCGSGNAHKNNWNGCVADRGNSNGPSSGNYDTNVVSPTPSNKATLFSADQDSDCPQAAMGLNYNWSAMNTLVNNMQPAGYTNQGIGLAVGWMSLVGGGPFTVPAKPSGYTYQDIILLFTDGLNTRNRWYSNQSQIDARQMMTCNNIKATGTKIYTVQISTDGTPQSQLLRDCASGATQYYYLTSASELVTTFSQIGNNMANLYVAK